MKSYNLLDEPWLPVRYADGQVKEVGLLQLFADADQISALAETAPPSLIALYRLLLAIVHRAFTRKFGTWTARDMARCYGEGLPVDVIHEYLERWRERFYVFHPEWPFMQVAALAGDDEVLKKEKPWTQISLDRVGGNNPVVFDHSVDANAGPISIARAMRDLLGYLQFTTGSLVKVLRDRGESGPLANTAAVLPLGETLAKTICLALDKPPLEMDRDLPAWERPSPQISDLRAEATLSSGSSDRYTRLIRAVLFLPIAENSTSIEKLLFAVGLDLHKEQHSTDPMVSYRLDKKGLRKLGFVEGRSIWRDFSAFLPNSDGMHDHRAAVINSAATLLRGSDIAATFLVAGLASDMVKVKHFRWRCELHVLPMKVLQEPDASGMFLDYLNYVEDEFESFKSISIEMLVQGMPDPKHPDTRSRARTVFDNGPTAAAYFSTLESRLPQLLDLIADKQLDAADTHWRAARLAAAELAWATVCRQLGDSARALRARAQSEPFYLGLLKPLRPDTESQPEEPSHV